MLSCPTHSWYVALVASADQRVNKPLCSHSIVAYLNTACCCGRESSTRDVISVVKEFMVSGVVVNPAHV
jgi:hypothetical protein